MKLRKEEYYTGCTKHDQRGNLGTTHQWDRSNCHWYCSWLESL